MHQTLGQGRALKKIITQAKLAQPEATQGVPIPSQQAAGLPNVLGYPKLLDWSVCLLVLTLQLPAARNICSKRARKIELHQQPQPQTPIPQRYSGSPVLILMTGHVFLKPPPQSKEIEDTLVRRAKGKNDKQRSTAKHTALEEPAPLHRNVTY